MARLNVSLTNEMAKKINTEADKRGKTISSMITEATNQYIDLRERGIDTDDLEDLMTYFELMTAARSVPIPFRLLDHILEVSISKSKERILSLFYEAGRMLGTTVRNYARDMSMVALLSEKLKKWLPMDDLRIWKGDGYWEIIVSGAGYGRSSSESLAEGIRGFIDAFDLKFQSIEIMEGFVKATVA